MALYGGSIPIEVKPGDKPVVVTVVCPNAYSHQRLMQALNSIVPEAASVPVFDEDEIPGYRCATGACEGE